MILSSDDANIAGDEPMQFKKKFPSLPVAVSESRNIGIPLLVKNNPDVKCILLDDAFQHRSVVPGMNILLTEYHNLFVDDMLLPAGRLREPKSSYSRADIIIITKCPDDLDASEKNRLLNRIKPYPYQKLFFSKYNYGDPYYLLDPSITVRLYSELKIHLISAIANVEYMIDYLEEECTIESVLKFEDHHYFSEHEMEHFQKIYINNPKDNIIFLTTEKDAMRLMIHKEYIVANNLPIFVLPITVDFMNDEKEEFDESIKHFLLNFKT
jgi:tetraacyldisaccharide 4'-kinase